MFPWLPQEGQYLGLSPGKHPLSAGGTRGTRGTPTDRGMQPWPVMWEALVSPYHPEIRQEMENQTRGGRGTGTPELEHIPLPFSKV